VMRPPLSDRVRDRAMGLVRTRTREYSQGMIHLIAQLENPPPA